MPQRTHIDDHEFIQGVNKDIDAHAELQGVAADWERMLQLTRDESLEQHRRAAMVMQEHQVTQRPFVLYLRSFEPEAARYHDDPGADGLPTTTWTTQRGATAFEKKLGAALAARRLLSLGIANPTDLTMRGVVPRLQLPNEGWQDVARNLIDHAAFIVMDCDVLAPGVLWELDAVRDAGRQDATVVVLPSRGAAQPQGDLKDVAAVLGAVVPEGVAPARDDTRLSACRVVCEDEIDFERLDEMPAFADLLAATMAANAAAPKFDPATYANYLNNTGLAHFRNNEFVEAIGLLQQSLLVRRSIDDPAGTLRTLMNLGRVLIDAGHPAESTGLLEEAHRLAGSLKQLEDEALAAAYAGVAYKLIDHVPEAIRWLDVAAPLVEAHSPGDLKDVLVHLGVLRERAGDLEGARACARKLKDIGAI